MPANNRISDNTLGTYIQETLGWNDRLFLTGAVRVDNNSAFGNDIRFVTYPKASLSWVMNEEGWFQNGAPDWLNTLRLRVAWGESGEQPASFSALRTWAAVTGPNSTAGVTPNTVGNADLTAEVGQETEVGFDADLMDSRLGLQFTYYNKLTKGAILERDLPPSGGFTGAQFVNAGEITNSGFEVSLDAQLVESSGFSWDVGLNFSSNSSEILQLSGEAGDTSIVFNSWSSMEHRVGHPPYSWFGVDVVSSDLDANGNTVNAQCSDGRGGTTPCFDAGGTTIAPRVFLGRAIAPYEISLTSDIAVGNNLRFHVLITSEQGHKRFDNTLRQRCRLYRVCRSNHHPQEWGPDHEGDGREQRSDHRLVGQRRELHPAQSRFHDLRPARAIPHGRQPRRAPARGPASLHVDRLDRLRPGGDVLERRQSLHGAKQPAAATADHRFGPLQLLSPTRENVIMLTNTKTIGVTTRAFACAALLAFSAACDVDSLLQVTDPSRLLSENVEIPAQAGALMNGLEADFLCAHGAFLVVTADLSDEYEDTNAGGDNWSLDRRRPQGQNAWADNDCTGFLPSGYVPASRARWVADNLVNLLESWSDAEVAMRTQRLARASLLAGFSLSMLGAAHCTIALDGGPEITSIQAFAEAEQRFSNAFQHAQEFRGGRHRQRGDGGTRPGEAVPGGRPRRGGRRPPGARGLSHGHLPFGRAQSTEQPHLGHEPVRLQLRRGSVDARTDDGRRAGSAHHHLRHRPEHGLGPGQRVGVRASTRRRALPCRSPAGRRPSSSSPRWWAAPTPRASSTGCAIRTDCRT